MQNTARNALFFLLFSLFLAGMAQGYVLTIEAPAEVRAGVPLEVTGNTTFPAGTQFDIVVYMIQTSTPQEVARRLVVVDETKAFQVSFPTTGFEAGKYKVEVQFLQDPGSRLGSDSVTLKILDIVDRSGDIVLTVDRDQVLGQALRIEGYIARAGVTTITMKITGPQGAVVPPQDVRTTTRPGKEDGYFSKSVPVEEPGNYYVDFSDPKGFMATIRFSVSKPLPDTTPVTTAEQTMLPATSQATPMPFPLTGVLIGMAAAYLMATRGRS
jgi:hypothetical protein